MEIHCSALPRLTRCPASQANPTIKIDSAGDAARLGSAVHDMLAHDLEGTHRVPSEVAKKYAVTVDQLMPLVYMGRQVWQDGYADMLTVLGTEISLSADLGGHTLCGRTDLIAHDADGQPVVWDWKTGADNRDGTDQLLGYAFPIMIEHPAYHKVTTVSCHIRERETDVRIYTAEDVMKWAERLERRLTHRNEYCPSHEACDLGYCPLKHECPARAQLVQSAAVVCDLEGFKKTMELATPADLAAARDQVKLVKAAVEVFEDTFKLHLRGGPIPDGKGRELFLRESVREKVELTPEAWRVIGKELAMDTLIEGNNCGFDIEDVMEDLTPALTVSKSALSDIIGAMAEKGKKGKTIKEFMNKLREHGAMSASTSHRVASREEGMDNE